MRDSYVRTTYPINVMPDADIGEIALDYPEEMENFVEAYKSRAKHQRSVARMSCI